MAGSAVGGAALTEELHPGFRNNVVAGESRGGSRGRGGLGWR